MTATALRNRLATLLLVAGVLVLFRGLWTDGSERAEALYVVVLGLGYGHLLGAALVGRRASGLRPQGVSLGLWRLFSVTSIGTLFLAYFALLELFPATSFLVVASPLLAISVWHTVENDTAVADAYGRGFRMRSIERQTQGRTMAITCLVALAAALASADEVIFAEVFAISTLYHLFQWLVFLSDRHRFAVRQHVVIGVIVQRVGEVDEELVRVDVADLDNRTQFSHRGVRETARMLLTSNRSSSEQE